MLLVASVAQGLAFGFYGPARVAFAAKLVGPDQLGNAITLSMLSLNGTRVFAPAFAGMLAGHRLLRDRWRLPGRARCSRRARSSNCSGVRTAPSRSRRPAGTRSPTSPTVSATSPPIPALRRLLVSSFFVIMFGFNYVAFIPALVKDTFGLSDGYVGVLMSASAIGAVIVALAIARHADGPHAMQLMLVSGAVFGCSVVALGVAPTFWTAFVVVGAIGAGATGYQSLSNTLALSMSDEGHRGRVQSLLMLSFAGFGIAALPLGLLAEVIGLRPAIVLMGVVATGACGAYAVAERTAAGAGVRRRGQPLSDFEFAGHVAASGRLPAVPAGRRGVDLRALEQRFEYTPHGRSARRRRRRGGIPPGRHPRRPSYVATVGAEDRRGRHRTDSAWSSSGGAR